MTDLALHHVTLACDKHDVFNPGACHETFTWEGSAHDGEDAHAQTVRAARAAGWTITYSHEPVRYVCPAAREPRPYVDRVPPKPEPEPVLVPPTGRVWIAPAGADPATPSSWALVGYATTPLDLGDDEPDDDPDEHGALPLAATAGGASVTLTLDHDAMPAATAATLLGITGPTPNPSAALVADWAERVPWRPPARPVDRTGWRGWADRVTGRRRTAHRAWAEESLADWRARRDAGFPTHRTITRRIVVPAARLTIADPAPEPAEPLCECGHTAATHFRDTYTCLHATPAETWACGCPSYTPTTEEPTP